MIQKNANGTYSARVGHGGTMRTFDFRKDAAEWESDEKNRRRREKAGMSIEQGPISYDALADLWASNHAPSQWRTDMLAHSRKRWGKALVQTIRPEQVGAWLHGLTFSPKTKTHILETMRQVCRAGVDWGYLRQSPVRPRAFKAPGEKRVREIRPFASWDEVILIAETLGKFGPLVRFVCATGLRMPSEVLCLTPADFDLKNAVVTIAGTKTANAQRTVPLSRNALAALEDVPWPLDKHQRLWTFDYEGFRKNHWTPALKLVDLEHRTPYEMRHTFATLALQEGAPIEDVSKVMGHGNIQITLDFYRKWTQPMMERLVSFLDKIGESEDEVRDSGHAG